MCKSFSICYKASRRWMGYISPQAQLPGLLICAPWAIPFGCAAGEVDCYTLFDMLQTLGQGVRSVIDRKQTVYLMP